MKREPCSQYLCCKIIFLIIIYFDIISAEEKNKKSKRNSGENQILVFLSREKETCSIYFMFAKSFLQIITIYRYIILQQKNMEMGKNLKRAYLSQGDKLTLTATPQHPCVLLLIVFIYIFILIYSGHFIYTCNKYLPSWAPTFNKKYTNNKKIQQNNAK